MAAGSLEAEGLKRNPTLANANTLNFKNYAITSRFREREEGDPPQMKLKIMFVALGLAFTADAVTFRITPAVADAGNACVYKPGPVECPCTTCS